MSTKEIVDRFNEVHLPPGFCAVPQKILTLFFEKGWWLAVYRKPEGVYCIVYPPDYDPIKTLVSEL